MMGSTLNVHFVLKFSISYRCLRQMRDLYYVTDGRPCESGSGLCLRRIRNKTKWPCDGLRVSSLTLLCGINLYHRDERMVSSSDSCESQHNTTSLKYSQPCAGTWVAVARLNTPLWGKFGDLMVAHQLVRGHWQEFGSGSQTQNAKVKT